MVGQLIGNFVGDRATRSYNRPERRTNFMYLRKALTLLRWDRGGSYRGLLILISYNLLVAYQCECELGRMFFMQELVGIFVTLKFVCFFFVVRSVHNNYGYPHVGRHNS